MGQKSSRNTSLDACFVLAMILQSSLFQRINAGNQTIFRLLLDSLSQSGEDKRATSSIFGGKYHGCAAFQVEPIQEGRQDRHPQDQGQEQARQDPRVGPEEQGQGQEEEVVDGIRIGRKQ